MYSMLTEKIQLEADEVILTQVRKHWFLITIQLISIIFIAVLPVVVPILLMFTPLRDWAGSNDASIVFAVLYIAWLVFSWMAFFSVWTNYYLDVWTITNKRLIIVDQRGLFNRTTGSFRLERLQDVNVTVQGVIATFLNYGNLQAETASDDRDFVAVGIPDPQGLKAIILEAADKTTYTSGGEPKPSIGEGN